jgi:hypothetical protein
LTRGGVEPGTLTRQGIPRLSWLACLEEWLMSRTFGVRRAALIAYWTTIFLMTHWPKVNDFPGVQWLPAGADKLAHFSFLAGWAVLWCWVLHGRGIALTGRVIGWLFAGGATYAVLDELTQAIVSRDPEVGDFIADMTGAAFALIVASWYLRRRARGRNDRRREQANA